MRATPRLRSQDVGSASYLSTALHPALHSQPVVARSMNSQTLSHRLSPMVTETPPPWRQRGWPPNSADDATLSSWKQSCMPPPRPNRSRRLVRFLRRRVERASSPPAGVVSRVAAPSSLRPAPEMRAEWRRLDHESSVRRRRVKPGAV